MNAADKVEQKALKQAGDVILDVYDVKNQHVFQKRDVPRDQLSFLFEDVRDIFSLDTKIGARDLKFTFRRTNQPYQSPTDSSFRARRTSYVALTKSPAAFSKVLPSSIGKASSLQVRIRLRFFFLFVFDVTFDCFFSFSKGVRYYTP